jgi:diacylglycerol kinase family enzyme
LTELFGYPGVDIGVQSSASSRNPELHLLLAIANASYFGGTFEIAPGAIATDGKLDAVSILNVPPWKRVGILAAAIRGKHERYRECVRERASEFTVSFAAPPTYETDGELHHAQTSTVTVSSCPGALRVVAAHRL